MKIQDIIDKMFENEPMSITNRNDEFKISGGLLELLVDNLLKCDEFKDVSSLNAINQPTQEINGKNYSSITMKLSDDYVFSGDVYLYSIELTPLIYDQDKYKRIENDKEAAITPTMYNHEDFSPYEEIVLKYYPHVDGAKTLVRQLLDDVLNDPTKYKTKGSRGIMVRFFYK